MIVIGADTHRETHTVAAVDAASGRLLGHKTAASAPAPKPRAARSSASRRAEVHGQRAALSVAEAADAARRDAELTDADPVSGAASAALCAALLALREDDDPLRAARGPAADDRRLGARAPSGTMSTRSRARQRAPRQARAGPRWRSRFKRWSPATTTRAE